jgi:hypothetical protein
MCPACCTNRHCFAATRLLICCAATRLYPRSSSVPVLAAFVLPAFFALLAGIGSGSVVVAPVQRSIDASVVTLLRSGARKRTAFHRITFFVM